MNKILLIAASFLTLNTYAQNLSQADVIQAYARRAFVKYSEAVSGAVKIREAVEKLIDQPTEAHLKIARDVWTEARKPYSETEVYRFYGGPIDSATGPEALINAWPLDEIYVDTIIENQVLYPKIDAQTLREANEKDGAKNISTGYHAIEYVLWGVDTFNDSPGRRPASDFDPKQNKFAGRRADYLRTVTAALIEDLTTVQTGWDPKTKNGYAENFVKKGNEKAALQSIFTGIIKLAGAELSQERMFVALDTKSQEEEHSCFSDTTHLDILHNFLGVKNVINDGLLDLIRLKDRTTASEIEDNLKTAEDAIRAMPIPFDQAIVIESSRRLVMDAISALEVLAESMKQGAISVGVDVP